MRIWRFIHLTNCSLKASCSVMLQDCPLSCVSASLLKAFTPAVIELPLPDVQDENLKSENTHFYFCIPLRLISVHRICLWTVIRYICVNGLLTLCSNVFITHDITSFRSRKLKSPTWQTFFNNPTFSAWHWGGIRSASPVSLWHPCGPHENHGDGEADAHLL